MNSAWVMAAITIANVVLPTPGGPHKIIELNLSCSIKRRRTFPGPNQMLLADKLIQIAGTNPVRQRRLLIHTLE